MPITIKEIARQAGVSIATVSMILNGKDQSISEGTRQKVLEIAKENNYIPNSMARGLVTRKSKTIGLILPDITNPFFPEIARGAEDKAREENYSIIFCDTDDSTNREQKCIETLTSKMVDGIIFVHAAENAHEEVSTVNECRVPIVVIDRDYNSDKVKGKVMVDNAKGANMAVAYLLESGCKKIAYIAGPPNTRTTNDRTEGYKKALEEYGIEYDEKMVKFGSYRKEWGEEAVIALAEENVQYDGLFCGNDMIAIGAMRTLIKMGRKIPEEIKVAGFDNIFLSSLVEPELTTVSQPTYKMGYQSMGILIEAIEKGSSFGEGREVIFEPELIIRKST